MATRDFQNWLMKVGIDLLQRGAPAQARVTLPSSPTRTLPIQTRRTASPGGPMLGLSIVIERGDPRRRTADATPARSNSRRLLELEAATVSKRASPAVPPLGTLPRRHVDLYERIEQRGSMLELD